MDITEIGYFQFNNLVRGRIPFILVNLGVDLSTWYKSVEAMHLANVSVSADENNVVELVQAKKLPPHFAIVVIDQDGSRAKNIVATLEAAGFLNAHHVRGGLKGLEKEKLEENL